jgi:hypothetical protein
MPTYRVQVAQMIREYATINITAETEEEAVKQARELDWEDLVVYNQIRQDYEYTEFLEPIVVGEEG